MDKIGAQGSPNPVPAPTPSDRGSCSTRWRQYVLNGSKTFITNGPYADMIVFICKLDEGNEPAERKVVQFVLDTGMPARAVEAAARWGCTRRRPARFPRRRALRSRPPARRE
jgi:alkylation response protein AidB-like acyl-CoA dehydrogenase